MPRLSLWRMLLLMLATYPTEPTQVWLGLWSIVWGVTIGNPLAGGFDVAPHAYAWMRPIPEWVWGAIWAGKGFWQCQAALRLSRAKTLHQEDADRARHCFYAARMPTRPSSTAGCSVAPRPMPRSAPTALHWPRTGGKYARS